MGRIEPVARPWSEDDAAGIARWMHPDAFFDPPELFQVLQRHPRLTACIQRVGGQLHARGLLAGRDREIVVLRVCGRARCPYEWGSHAAFHGPRAGVSDELAGSLAVGRAGALHDLSDRDHALVQAVDELEDSGSLTQATWNLLGRWLSDEQRIELVILVGWYRTMCTLANALAVEPEPWMRPWPEDGKAEPPPT